MSDSCDSGTLHAEQWNPSAKSVVCDPEGIFEGYRALATRMTSPQARHWASLLGLPHDQDDRVTSEEEFAQVSLLLDRFGLATFVSTWILHPDLVDFFQDQVHVAIEGFDLSDQLSVVSAGDNDALSCLVGLNQQFERSCVESLLLWWLWWGLGWVFSVH